MAPGDVQAGVVLPSSNAPTAVISTRHDIGVVKTGRNLALRSVKENDGLRHACTRSNAASFCEF